MRDLKNESQTLQAEQNRLSKEIGRAAAGEAREKAKADSTALKEKIERLTASWPPAEAALDEMLLELPNLPHPSVPVGKDDSENRRAARGGQQARLRLRAQAALGPRHRAGHHRLRARREDLGLALLRAQGLGRAAAARADHAACSTCTPQKHGYTEIYPPYMVRRECLVGTGNLPKFGDNLYRDAEEDFWFIPTAEVPVTNLYRDEILDGAQLPIKHVAYTACFRREQMAAGRDTRGIKRGHQFDKVELVKFVRPETSMDELTACSPTPKTCSRRWSCPTAWCRCAPATCRSRRWPSSISSCGRRAADEWLEVSSCSNFGDFQARRARIRFRDGAEKGKNRFVHTLNGSGLALPRTLIGVLETYQRADGARRARGAAALSRRASPCWAATR